MSEMEYNAKKLTPVTMDRDIAKNLCMTIFEGEEIPSYYKTYLEWLLSESEEYEDIPGLGICKVTHMPTSHLEDSWCRIVKNPYADDKSIYFESYHYNGGAHWTEVVEAELKKQCET